MNNNLEQILTLLVNEIDIIVDSKVDKKMSELKKSSVKHEKPLLTVSEAAEYLCLSPKTIYKYVQTGKLNYYKPNQIMNKNGFESAKNTKLLFKKSELNDYLLNEDYHYYSDNNLEQEANTRIAINRL